ncbi:hypothetical protein TBLA_0H02900 [Henningerozyma blattae CBS 6284]|uniref:Glutamate--cysteine ligase n=1 Tax=Henningerozyma blattae (strain ATCC 34711 / CBS 6284 / DSM 70876 / NBRC 10599 / NRRL Y-10934 / UCD 77-7) TaxID=1071380 RepID=I2H872_HENB6|nr:hypothetical protein TBLA_0H02900 [Tetrapisispora blattae CBS 6284]CCH62574.1 hypothetical protein TBLA_0H02900 [Tetrapisispora blattae CBS 6284]
MGLLSLGTPLPWEESCKYNEHIRSQGVIQLLNVFKKYQNIDNYQLYWGDEVEYMLLQFNESKNNCVLDLLHDNLLTEFNENEGLKLCNSNNVHFHPEYGRFMLESTPAKPYKDFMGSYIEKNMIKRRLIASNHLARYNTQNLKHVPLSLTVYPRMGCSVDPYSKQFEGFTNLYDDEWTLKNSASKSLFLPDQVINKHARFPTLTANIRLRRGEKVQIHVPMYKDSKTPEFDDSLNAITPKRNGFPYEDKQSLKALKKNHIYMDAMGFGMGCSCLQLTFQAPNITQARYLYDSLVNFAPIMLAVTAASPGFKGFLSDQDVRWNIISSAVDDRTPYERATDPLIPEECSKFGGIDPSCQPDIEHGIPKSRYSSVDLFLGGNKYFTRKYNNTDVPVNETVLQKLLENDLAPLDYDLAKHFSHLFIRDPLVIFEELIDQDNSHSTNHFENIQSTNWQTLRFKPPLLPESDNESSNVNPPGWRVEFRPMEVQLTDFENAAFSTFLYLIVDSILSCNISMNPYLKMSKVWKNMEIAHLRNAATNSKFYWKNSFQLPLSSTPTSTSYNDSPIDSVILDNESTSLYPIDEIFHNKQNGIFTNFINPSLRKHGLVKKDWVELKNSPRESESFRIYQYLKLISNRANGKLKTPAKFLKDFILNHKDYKNDSKISKSINYDLLLMCERITLLDNSNSELTGFFGQEIADYLLDYEFQSPIAN